MNISAGRIRGCLSGAIGLVVIVGIVAGIGYLILGSFTSSPVYVKALQAAQADPRVVDALGAPVQAGWLVTGSIEEQGISGDASLNIPLTGARKSGMLYAAARKGNGVWQFYTLAVRVDGQSDLIVLKSIAN